MQAGEQDVAKSLKKKKRIAMHDAAAKGDLKMIEKLHLEDGLSIDQTDVGGWSPMHFSASEGQVAALELLGKLGAEKDAKDKSGQTPMHICASRGNPFTLEALGKMRANKDERDKLGYTPMHRACYKGHDSAVFILFKIGADEDIVDNDGRTALDLAKEYGHIDLVANWNDIKARAEEERNAEIKETRIFIFLRDKVRIEIEKEALAYAKNFLACGFDSIQCLPSDIEVAEFISKPVHVTQFLAKLQECRNIFVSVPMPPLFSASQVPANENKLYLVNSGATYVLGKKIYSGNHDIYEGTKLAVKVKQYVVKFFKKEHIASYNHEINFYKEMEKDPLSKKYIVEAIEWEEKVTFQSDFVHVIVLEKGEMNLLQWLNSGEKSYKQKELKMFELVASVKFLHDKGFVHLDLKPSNIALFEKDKEMIVKLIDFDSYRRYKDFIGDGHSAEYTAPEVWLNRKEKSDDRIRASYSLDIWSLGMIFTRLFQRDSKIELMLSESTEEFEKNPKLIESLVTLSFKHELLSKVKDTNNSKLIKLVETYMLVQERERDTSITQINNHGFFNTEAVSGGLEKVVTELEKIKDGIAVLNKSVNNISILVKNCNGLLDFPINFIVIPKQKSGFMRNLFKKKSAKVDWRNFSFKGFKSNISNAKDKALSVAGLQTKVIFMFICDGCKTDPRTECTRTHEGFYVKLPGETLRKIGPALVLTAKVLKVALKVGKIATGLPIPSGIAGVEELEALLDSYSGMLDFPLDSTETTLYTQLGNILDPSNPPCQSDLLASISDQMDSAGKEIKSEYLEFVKSSYTEAQKWLSSLDPSWEKTKKDYDLSRYKKGGDILWLCKSHGRKSGLEKYIDDYA